MQLKTDYYTDKKYIVVEVGDRVQVNGYCRDYEDQFGSIVKISNSVSIWEKTKYTIAFDNGTSINVFAYQFDLNETSEYYTLLSACK